MGAVLSSLVNVRGGHARMIGVSPPVSVPQKMFSFDNSIAPNTDFGETSLFGCGMHTNHAHGSSRIQNGSK